MVIKTDSVGLAISSQDGVTERAYIYHSEGGTKDFTIDAPVGSTTKGILFRTNYGQDRMRIGYDGRVGINTLTPAGLLEVRNSGTQYLLYGSTGNLEVYGAESQRSDTFIRLGAYNNSPAVYTNAALNLVSDNNNDIIFKHNTSEIMRIEASGKVLYIGPFESLSDDRIKSYERPLTNTISFIKKMKPTHYKKHPTLILDEDNETPDLSGVAWKYEYGFIAQELESDPVLSHFVTTHPETGIKYVNYIEMIPLLCGSIKELNNTVEKQQNTIDSLILRIEALENM